MSGLAASATLAVVGTDLNNHLIRQKSGPRTLMSAGR